MPYRLGIDVLNEGLEKARRDEYWLMYCCAYPHMTQDNFEQFSTWYESIVRPAPKQSKEDIMNRVAQIIAMTL